MPLLLLLSGTGVVTPLVPSPARIYHVEDPATSATAQHIESNPSKVVRIAKAPYNGSKRLFDPVSVRHWRLLE